jgi:Integrase core domain
MGIRDHLTAPRSPWQNGHVERLIGSIRRECLDHIVVMGEASLRRTLKAYACYYNEVRTHRSLSKDALEVRAIQFTGVVRSRRAWRTSLSLRPGLAFQYTQPFWLPSLLAVAIAQSHWQTEAELRALIGEISQGNPLWGVRRQGH